MDVRLPNLGEGVDSGSVVSLAVKEGDVIAKGQTILELENEKAVAPIPSPAHGRIASIRVKTGDKINVGQVILTLSPSEGESAAAPAVSSASPKPRTQTEPPKTPAQPVASPGQDFKEPDLSPSARAGFPPPASPSIRKLAKDLGIDLSRVRGSESGGRIVLQDLRSHIQRLQQIVFPQKTAPADKPAGESIDFAKWGPVSTQPLTALRQVISRRMTENWTTIPHVTQFDQVDITAINDLRKKYAPAYESAGARLTLTAFVFAVLGDLLKQHPLFNSSIDEIAQALVLKQYIHIGLAVDTEAGLVVPVLRDVPSKSLRQLSQAIQTLAANARERKLTLDDMKGGTFTVSNQGGIGSAHFTPIINKPEVAILGLGRGALQPVVRHDQIVARWLLPAALSYDHRLIDGGSAARFMVDFAAALQNFNEDRVRL